MDTELKQQIDFADTHSLGYRISSVLGWIKIEKDGEHLFVKKELERIELGAGVVPPPINTRYITYYDFAGNRVEYVDRIDFHYHFGLIFMDLRLN